MDQIWKKRGERKRVSTQASKKANKNKFDLPPTPDKALPKINTFTLWAEPQIMDPISNKLILVSKTYFAL